MAKYMLVRGATGVTAYVFIQDSSSSTGAGLTGLAFNTASLTAYYVRPLEAAAAITLATQTVTGAWSSGGFVEVSSGNMPGWYRLDIPDAAFATGVPSVGVQLKGATNMAQANLEIQLSQFNVNSLTQLGVVAQGTAQSATGTTLVLAAAEVFANDTPNGMTLLAYGSTQGYWQSRQIIDYDLATDTATVDTWTVTPSGTISYVVIATPPAAASGTLPLVNASAAQSATVSAATAQSSAESTTLSSVAIRATSAAESATLSAISLVPSLVMSVAASANGIHANVQQINDVTVVGVGTAGNKWRA